MCRTLVNAVMNLGVAYNAGSCLTSLASRTVFHGVWIIRHVHNSSDFSPTLKMFLVNLYSADILGSFCLPLFPQR